MNGTQRLALEERLIEKSELKEILNKLLLEAKESKNKNSRAFAIDMLHHYVAKLEKEYKLIQFIETKRIITHYEKQLYISLRGVNENR